MTTVAWDGKTLAADSQSTTGTVRGTAAKIAKSKDGFLVAGSGEHSVVKMWINWVLAGMPPDQQPTSAAESSILVVDPRGRATVFYDIPVAQPLPRKQWALGSGSDIALGAMAMGADARTAVKVAARFDVYTGGKIVVLTPGVKS
jgi:ATP-dependent protease HslVU (ClpYQ) peptidase subunit